jgi:UDP-glucuronate 4-epimerase
MSQHAHRNDTEELGAVKTALITGGAGFIGSHLTDRLLAEGWHVTAVDNFDLYYDPAIKRRNIAGQLRNKFFRLLEIDIRDWGALRRGLDAKYDVIVHLAAKAGVRPSLKDPMGYQDVNVRGTQNILDLARELSVPQFVFASSSSVYGVNPNVPWREDDSVLLPISPYASTKVSGETLGQSYSQMYGIRFLALRFFTAYGPRQRPDLAIHKFTRSILDGRPIPFFGNGTARRDYTFIDDIISGIRAAIDYRGSNCEAINVGNGGPVTLWELVSALEELLGLKATLDYQPVQPGDVPQTYADVGKAKALLGYHPRTALSTGLKRFVEWLTAESQAGLDTRT